MSDIINILPDSVANQIAAGEVVDRPASAIKELLENAVDAGADEIQLIVKDAGRTLIQVIDNGCGMSDSDARLCFERHATSKIHRADDLFAIKSMGFRGEALAAISAVAQIELKTRQHDSELGTMVVIEGSEVIEQTPCSCSVGTSIAVKNLFFNIPARRNFLKKDSIELSHIEEIFKRIALVNYTRAFSFYHNGKLLYDIKAGNFAQRIASLFGGNSQEKLYHIHENTDIVRVEGYVGKAEYVRKTRGEQYIFVNNRYIKHIGLSAAIEKAYAEMIPERTYPSYFVMLEVDPARIDVNIHPTKTEVRFTDESVIFAILRAATKRAIGQYSLANEIDFNPSTEFDFSPPPPGYVPQEPKTSFNNQYNPFANSDPSPRSSNNSTYSPCSSAAYLNFFDDAKRENNIAHPESTPTPEFTAPSAPKTYNPTNDVICFLNKYIVTTLKSGILVIDRQRAHERILYERLSLYMEQKQPISQQLMFPINCTFSAGDSELILELMDELKQIGFDIAPLNRTTFVVTATPTEIAENEVQNILDQMVHDYKSSMLQKFSDRNQSLCTSLAKQLAIKPGNIMTTEEMQQLIADLFTCQVPHTSPSGKRTMQIFNEQDLAEKFK